MAGELPQISSDVVFDTATFASAHFAPIDLLHPNTVATVAEEAHAGLGTSLMNAVASGIPWKTVAMKLLVLAAEEFIAWAKEQPAPVPPVNQ